ncbi:MAG TPA: metallophosphoesterase [Pseudoxanthomonas sp.]|nr:metallophosphoesterase [Pseudoxanthomonas sp.]
MDKVLIKQILFYASWLAWPFIAWLLWRLWTQRKPAQRALVGLLLLGSLVFVWARFVEPQWIQVRHTTLAGSGVQARIALISDVHLGVYKSPAYLQRVVERLNELDVDAVAIAGDLTYEPQVRPESLAEMFAPLSQLRMPVYAVLGNHDQQMPGPDIDLALRAALRSHGVRIIEGTTESTAAGYRWAGLGDRWAQKDDPSFLRARADPAVPTLLLVHNPDSAMQLRPGDAALVLAGHTHGGQIRIPWLYQRVIPTEHGFDRGEQWAPAPQGRVRVFTTSGLGEIGLPLRLFNPPVIDVLQLQR